MFERGTEVDLTEKQQKGMTFIKSPPFVIQTLRVRRSGFLIFREIFRLSGVSHPVLFLLFFLCSQLRDGLAEFFAEGVEPVEQLLADAVVVCPA